MSEKIIPFDFQKSTNIDEHNQIVDKVNEIVDVVNDIDLDGLAPRLDADEANIAKNASDISQLKISDTEHTSQISTLDNAVDNHAREITALKTSDAQQNSKLTELDTITDSLTKELPTEITLYRDGTGKIKAQVTKEDETTFDSNTLDMVIPYQWDIISGTTERSFKLEITFSDGSKQTTDDFVIPAGGGTSVSITAITLNKDSANPNKFKASVKLDDGSTIDSGYIEMVTAVSGSFANKKLTITVNGVSSVPITIDAEKSYSAGEGIAISENNAISISQSVKESIGDSFNSVSLGSDGKSLDFTANDGQINNIAIPSSTGWVKAGEFNLISQITTALMGLDNGLYQIIAVDFLYNASTESNDILSGLSSGSFRKISNTEAYLQLVAGPLNNPIQYGILGITYNSTRNYNASCYYFSVGSGYDATLNHNTGSDGDYATASKPTIIWYNKVA